MNSESEPAFGRRLRRINSSTGTLGLYKAMKILGYKPYHAYELLTAGGALHMELAEEAITAHHGHSSGSRRFDRADYDKWMAEYDVSQLGARTLLLAWWYHS